MEMGRQLSGSCSHFCYCCPAALSHIILCLCFSCLCGVYLHRDCKPLWLLQSSHGLEVFTARPWAHRGPSASSFSFVLPQCRVVLLIPLICLTCKKKKIDFSSLLPCLVWWFRALTGLQATARCVPTGSPAAGGEAFTPHQADQA